MHKLILTILGVVFFTYGAGCIITQDRLRKNECEIWGLLTILEHFSEIALKEKDFYFEFERLGCGENVY